VEKVFENSALVILAHGSVKNLNSGNTALDHAEEIRSLNYFSEVQAGFWKQSPSIHDVLSKIESKRVFVVPLFISAGFFAEEKIPADLGFEPGRRTLTQNGQTLYYCSPVGTHPGITEVLLARAEEVVVEHPFPIRPAKNKTALFIAGHGTEQNPDSHRSITDQVEKVRSLGLYGEMHSIFMDEEPRISVYHSMTSLKHVVVIPFFISDGLHSFEEIPVLLGEPANTVKERFASGLPTWRNPSEKHGKLVWYGKSVGTHPRIQDIILKRVQEAATSGV
jgi:sirohydrochlorin cobaltochelatase